MRAGDAAYLSTRYGGSLGYGFAPLFDKGAPHPQFVYATWSRLLWTTKGWGAHPNQDAAIWTTLGIIKYFQTPDRQSRLHEVTELLKSYGGILHTDLSRQWGCEGLVTYFIIMLLLDWGVPATATRDICPSNMQGDHGSWRMKA